MGAVGRAHPSDHSKYFTLMLSTSMICVSMTGRQTWLSLCFSRGLGPGRWGPSPESS